jgi:hypothetical protein
LQPLETEAKKQAPQRENHAMLLPDSDVLLASVVHFLLTAQERDEAAILCSCSLTIEGTALKDPGSFDGSLMAILTLRGPRPVYELAAAVNAHRRYEELDLETKACQETLDRIANAFRAVMPPPVEEVSIRYRAQLVEIDADWRHELQEIARGKRVHNQALDAERVLIWANHRFRSQAEIKIAEALDRAKLLFLPNCKARLGFSNRENREPDFLVCWNGKWGILEVDGEPFHPPSRAVDDHERDRLFNAHGIMFVQHFDAGECYESADTVVKKFLFLLDKS